ncbi:hypothetical protein BH09PAT2_BH09PAT2_01930 [soil metagenome]
MDYLKALQYIAEVDRNDTVISKVERWKAHEQGILHRAFTLTITFEDQIILQHRRHPVFDGIFDVTISSHPIYVDDILQDPIEAVYNTLKREWNIQKNDLKVGPKYVDKFYYQAADPHSKYQEHEICYVYTCEINQLSIPNLESAYGFSLQKKDQIQNKNNYIYPLLAPWVHKMIEEKLL